MKRKKKLVWIPVVAVVLAAVVVAVAVLQPGKARTPVYVYRISDGLVGMTDYYENSESYGEVTTDRIQPVYLTDTQTVTNVAVKEGQSVKKGDVLFTYDTTLSELQLERKSLSIEQMKLNLQTAQKELTVIKGYRPISYRPTTPTKATTSDPKKEGLGLKGLVEKVDHLIYSGAGTSALKPKYCWLRSTAMVDETIMEELFTGVKGTQVYVVFQHTQKDAGDGDVVAEYGVLLVRSETTPAPPTPTDPTTEPTEEPTEPSTEEPTEPPTEEPTEPAPTTETGTDQQDQAQTYTAQAGIVVQATTEYTYKMSFFEPPEQQPDTPEPTEPADNVDWNSGYTASEIAAMRKEKEEEIQTLTFDIKMAESEYKIMQKEADDGKVTAEFDGVVIGILDPAEARQNNQPLLRVSGGGGFYVQGTVSELALNTISVGQEVQITSWDTWETYTGTVSEIGKYPVDSDTGYYGSENVTYYPYKVFIDGDANLQDGYYVSMVLEGNQEESSGMYLNSAFVLTEKNGSYVYVRGEDGLLEKRAVQTGKTLWDSYVEICSGLHSEDAVAFPYGRDVREGAPTQDGDNDTLYGGV